MVKYPDSTKTSLQQRLSERARQRWPELARVAIRHRGAFSGEPTRYRAADLTAAAGDQRHATFQPTAHHCEAAA